MIDTHIHPENWGVKPALFSIGNIAIESYPVFVALALLVGIVLYYYNVKKAGSLGDNSFYIAVAAVAGGTLGAKIPIWIINLPVIIEHPSLSIILSGRTITGGLIGGMLSVIWMKKRLGIKTKRGNLFAPSVALGIAIGRLACFLRGCCYGVVTDLPWGVDFGDGLHRHPTQIYEMIFAFGLFVYFQFFYKRPAVPGEMFQKLMIYYFVFRFFEEFLRENYTLYFYLSYFQWISIAVIIYLFREKIINIFKVQKYE